jgi:hypothetical protein
MIMRASLFYNHIVKLLDSVFGCDFGSESYHLEGLPGSHELFIVGVERAIAVTSPSPITVTGPDTFFHIGKSPLTPQQNAFIAPDPDIFYVHGWWGRRADFFYFPSRKSQTPLHYGALLFSSPTTLDSSSFTLIHHTIVKAQCRRMRAQNGEGGMDLLYHSHHPPPKKYDKRSRSMGSLAFKNIEGGGILPPPSCEPTWKEILQEIWERVIH